MGGGMQQRAAFLPSSSMDRRHGMAWTNRAGHQHGNNSNCSFLVPSRPPSVCPVPFLPLFWATGPANEDGKRRSDRFHVVVDRTTTWKLRPADQPPVPTLDQDTVHCLTGSQAATRQAAEKTRRTRPQKEGLEPWRAGWRGHHHHHHNPRATNQKLQTRRGVPQPATRALSPSCCCFFCFATGRKL